MTSMRSEVLTGASVFPTANAATARTTCSPVSENGVERANEGVHSCSKGLGRGGVADPYVNSRQTFSTCRQIRSEGV